MAVYERNYGRYQGELTPTRSRFLVLPRYAMKDVFDSRGFVAFFAICCLLPFAGLLIIYLHHNLSALNFLHLPLDKLMQLSSASSPTTITAPAESSVRSTPPADTAPPPDITTRRDSLRSRDRDAGR